MTALTTSSACCPSAAIATETGPKFDRHGAEIDAQNYELKALSPNAEASGDERMPAQLLDIIEVKGKEIAEIVAALRAQG